MRLPKNAVEAIERVRLGFVATVTPGGAPRVSPKGTFIVAGKNSIAFGEIRSPGTLANLAANPACEVNFVDQFTRKGVRIRGGAELLAKDTPDFEALIPQFQFLWSALADRINVIVRITASEILPLSTPPYDDGATEEEMIALYKAKFAEMYP